MNIIDYSVSKEEFFLEYDPVYKLYRTTPVPQELGRYYQVMPIYPILMGKRVFSKSFTNG